MSIKYQKLVEEYAEEIEAIKNQKLVVNALQEKYNIIINEVTEFTLESYAEQCDLEVKLREQNLELTGLYEELTQEIYNEYAEVIFRKTANQGITKFWELANEIINAE